MKIHERNFNTPVSDFNSRPGKGNPLPVRTDPQHEPPDEPPGKSPKRKKKSIYEIVMA